MNGTVRRLEKVAIHLTAHERAVLVLRAWKEGRAEDRSWRAAMPDDQRYAFNRLITLMNGVNDRLIDLVLVTALEVDKLELRLGLLAAFTLWTVQASHVDDVVRVGKLNDDDRAVLEDALTHAPRVPLVYISEEFQALLAKEAQEPSKVDEAAQLYRERVRDGVLAHGPVLQAAEVVVDEVTEAFGEDPLVAEYRKLLDNTRRRFDAVREGAEEYTGPLTVGEPDDELLAKLRRLVERAR